MRKLFSIGMSTALLSFSMLASAGEPPKQNHHCKMPDGTIDASKTRVQCKAAKGTWARDMAEVTPGHTGAPNASDATPAATGNQPKTPGK